MFVSTHYILDLIGQRLDVGAVGKCVRINARWVELLVSVGSIDAHGTKSRLHILYEIGHGETVSSPVYIAFDLPFKVTGGLQGCIGRIDDISLKIHSAILRLLVVVIQLYNIHIGKFGIEQVDGGKHAVPANTPSKIDGHSVFSEPE